tara:strand:+ start:78 stop:275 length:198 start_codon:yes stop_codon:yes gene_type:complete
MKDLFETPEERLWKSLSTVPIGYTTRGQGTEEVRVSKNSYLRHVARPKNLEALAEYLFYKGVISK